MVEVHQVIKSLAGDIIGDQTIYHVYFIQMASSNGWTSGNPIRITVGDRKDFALIPSPLAPAVHAALSKFVGCRRLEYTPPEIEARASILPKFVPVSSGNRKSGGSGTHERLRSWPRRGTRPE